MSQKLYLDSNVWINYLWVEKVVSLPKRFAKNNGRRERDYKIVSWLLNKKKFKIISSLFNDTEISGYFRDYLRFIKGLSLGFDYTNSHKYKKLFSLSEKEKKEITSYFKYISNQDSVEITEPQLDEKSLIFFRMATCDYYLDYMDAFNLISALIDGCEYLITEDKEFKRKGNKLLRDNLLIKDIKIIDGKEALSYLKFPIKRSLIYDKFAKKNCSE